MILIDNPTVPEKAKDLIEYVETTFNFTVVAYPSHTGDKRPTTNFFFTFPDIQSRAGGDQGFYREYAYDYYTYNLGGFKVFNIENGPGKIDYFLVKLVRFLSGIVLVIPPVFCNPKETTIKLPEFTSLAELKMKMGLKGI